MKKLSIIAFIIMVIVTILFVSCSEKDTFKHQGLGADVNSYNVTLLDYQGDTIKTWNNVYAIDYGLGIVTFHYNGKKVYVSNNNLIIE